MAVKETGGGGLRDPVGGDGGEWIIGGIGGCGGELGDAYAEFCASFPKDRQWGARTF